jgi:hypothetical protein
MEITTHEGRTLLTGAKGKTREGTTRRKRGRSSSSEATGEEKLVVQA